MTPRDLGEEQTGERFWVCSDCQNVFIEKIVIC